MLDKRQVWNTAREPGCGPAMLEEPTGPSHGERQRHSPESYSHAVAVEALGVNELHPGARVKEWEKKTKMRAQAPWIIKVRTRENETVSKRRKISEQ